ncbi:MAG TPA: pantetheine-phosphate adenylyltransferase [Flavobacteriaceae bacterium]|jgi:pantetheine-phosphate adenylyltransferase|nr:pantetheine-phosphate adenylyltransferase [Flavobacteriaceae bacterium]MAY52622.1 pantetheine-phosphate adenylyltransferase [Flavobacteriaceae bacterium]HBR55793.1 pantetheine-phosphate adenylyltransferase [Flavobacteriaceae bacterium]HIB46670.1 pantetheine-phosphate adenylyltransferase [Flavobacteriaceae bacterium]HIN97988.1 pantetheine-phosphate adenylyltransferase [Flavobacteriaceae bacterium]|tara:strand:+ start:11259 stop:11696 length:438 start_codon:yes stop_codon:yes gene_type:complete
MRRAVFPGSFDPITLGHVDIVTRALPLFDEIIIAIGVNANKSYMWPLDERIEKIEAAFRGNTKVTVASYEGLTANFCKEQQAQFILRGLRNTTDFNYEQTIAQANEKVNGVDSIFLICSPEFSHISSSIVRDIARNGGDFASLIP